MKKICEFVILVRSVARLLECAEGLQEAGDDRSATRALVPQEVPRRAVAGETFGVVAEFDAADNSLAP